MTNDGTIKDIDSKLNHIALAILNLLRKHPAGLDIDEIKGTAAQRGDQMHLDRRLRSLRKYYHLPGQQEGGRFVYRLGARKTAATDSGAISGKLRAATLNLAKGRCQMCGKPSQKTGSNFR